jgi:phospholipase C
LDFIPLFDFDRADIFNTLESFKNDCATGQLPAYSFIEPNFFNPHNDMHPSTPDELVDGGPQKISPVLLGEALVLEVYNAIFTSPHHWDNTLLIITFDEHGGCYDHVAPPGRYGDHVVLPAEIATPPDLNGYTKWDDFDFNRLGLRVPTIMVSPYIRKNTIINTPCPIPRFSRPCTKNGDSPRSPPARMHLPVFTIPDFCGPHSSARICRTCRSWLRH